VVDVVLLIVAGLATIYVVIRLCVPWLLPHVRNGQGIRGPSIGRQRAGRDGDGGPGASPANKA
jgi:hypothetical protein